MAKIEKASEDIVSIFEKVKNETTIPHWIMFEILCNNKQNELIKINKLNDVVEVLTDGVNFSIVLNEEIFDGLPDDLQELAFEECLAGVMVKESNDALSLEKTNFNTYTGVLEKFGHELVVSLHESIKSLYEAKKQREDEEKAQTKGKRGRKRGI